MSAKEWASDNDWLPEAKGGGRPRRVDVREGRKASPPGDGSAAPREIATLTLLGTRSVEQDKFSCALQVAFMHQKSGPDC